MLQRQSAGAKCSARDGEGGDLDDLALAAGGGASLPLRLGDVSLGGGGVATVGRQHGVEGVLDGARPGVHIATIHQLADLGLSCH